MALVRRANTELYVNDEFVDKYLAQGYDLINESGDVIREGIPNDIQSLRLKYFELTAKVKEQAQEIEKLNSQIKALKKKNIQ